MESTVETLPDDQVLAAANWTLPEDLRQELIVLINAYHDRELTHAERARHDDLMQIYRRNLVRKAQALQVAVERGLVPPFA
jgi:hypothetical protein